MYIFSYSRRLSSTSAAVLELAYRHAYKKEEEVHLNLISKNDTRNTGIYRKPKAVDMTPRLLKLSEVDTEKWVMPFGKQQNFEGMSGIRRLMMCLSPFLF